MGNAYKISVRSFVEHVYRSGSLETGFCSGAAMQRAPESIRKFRGRMAKGKERECSCVP